MKKLLILVLVSAIALGFTGCGDAVRTVAKEYRLSSTLVKYEWFKDASQALQAKEQTIKIYEARQAALESQYKDVARKDWARSDAEQSNVWSQELAGLKGSYNLLAAEYNSNMSKVNWRYASTDNAQIALPRQFTEK